MRILLLLLVGTGLAGSVGCTHHSLSRNTVHVTSTVMDIHYGSVLSNVAMMSCHPEALPNHVHLADGVVQINDQVAIGEAGGFTALGGDFGLERFGPSARRKVSEQWGTDATTDPERLYDLQSLYRVALGLSPLPPSNAIDYLRQEGRFAEEEADDESGDAEDDSSDDDSDGGSDGSGEDEHRRVPIEVLLADVPPPGWYHVGCKEDVPEDACYVGNWGDRYAWVTANGMPQLAQFTAATLTVIKLKPGEGGGTSGLAFTGGG